MFAAGMESDFSDSDIDMVYSSTITEKNENKNQTIENQQRKEIPLNGTINSTSATPDSKNDRQYNSRNFSKSRHQNKNHVRRQGLDYESSQLLDDLRYAIIQGNLKETQNIVEKGIYADTILKAGWTGLMYACSSGYPEIVDYFLKQNANTNYHKDMFTPLMAVCASQKNEEDLSRCCTLLLEKGANVNAHERHYTSPLMFAAKEGHLSLVKQLLEHGADPNVQDSCGKTALSWAAFNGHGKIIRLLIEKGADASIVNNMGQSPGDLAYEKGHKEIHSLLQKGNILQIFPPSGDNLEEENSNKSLSELPKPLRFCSGQKNYVKVGEMEIFLSGIGLAGLVSKFEDHELKFSDLLLMDDAELEKIGIVQVGVRKKILEACKSVHKKDWENSSLPNLKDRQFISCPDAVAMMGNIAKHLKYISCSVIYIRQQIQSQPRILELSQDSANVHNLLDEMEDSLKNVRNLNDELRFLKMHLEKLQDQVQYIPADLIVETIPRSRKQTYLFFLAVGVVSISAAITGFVWKYPHVIIRLPTFVRIKVPSFHFPW